MMTHLVSSLWTFQEGAIIKLQQEKDADVASINRQLETTKQSLDETDVMLRSHKENLTMVFNLIIIGHLDYMLLLL